MKASSLFPLQLLTFSIIVMKEPLRDIEIFKKHFDFGNIKEINTERIEVRSRNLEYGMQLAKRLITKHKLKLEVKNDAEMAAYNAFEILAS